MTVQDVPINDVPLHFENDLCEGSIVIMLCPAQLRKDETWRYMEWFRGKSRRTEVQVQVRFKQTPPENPWVRLSPKPLDQVNLTFVTYIFCEIILACMGRIFGSNFTWSFGGNGDAPHMSLPLSSIMSVSVTDLGKPPPRLGTQDMASHKTSSARMQKRWAEALPFDLEHIYTFSFFSMYIDVAQWTLANVPGISQIGLENFWPEASWLDVVLYSNTTKGSKVFCNLCLDSKSACLMHNTCDGRLIDLGKNHEHCRGGFRGVPNTFHDVPYMSRLSHSKASLHFRKSQRGCNCVAGLLRWFQDHGSKKESARLPEEGQKACEQPPHPSKVLCEQTAILNQLFQTF